jgi:hypothetical protein
MYNFELYICRLVRSPAHCIEYVKLIQWEHEREDQCEFDADNEEHMTWVYEKALERAKSFGIEARHARPALTAGSCLTPDRKLLSRREAIARHNVEVLSKCALMVHIAKGASQLKACKPRVRGQGVLVQGLSTLISRQACRSPGKTSTI